MPDHATRSHYCGAARLWTAAPAWLIVGDGVPRRGILLGLTLNDCFTRHWAVYRVEGAAGGPCTMDTNRHALYHFPFGY